MLLIRPFNETDRPTHVFLRQQLWPGPAEEHAAELAALAGRPTFRAFGAWTTTPTGDDADPPAIAIGFAEATVREAVDGAPATPALAAFLEGIWVAAAHRRSGVARRLLAAVEAWAWAAGCRHLGSNADLDNEASHRWHARLGFEETGRTVNFARPLRAPEGETLR